MNGFSALMYTLALVLWMQARITSSSTSVTKQAQSNNVRTNIAASASVTVPAPQHGISSTVASASVTVQAPQHGTSSTVASASVSVPAPQNVTSSPIVSASVSVSAPQNGTSSPIASASVTVPAPQNVTSSPIASASVSVPAPQNGTSSPIASASVTVPAPQNGTSSTVASTFAVQASHNVTKASVASISAGSNLSSTAAVQTYNTASSVLMTTLTSSMSSVYPSANSTTSVNGSASPRPTPGISSSVPSSETSKPSTQGSPNASVSFTSSTNMTKSLSSADVLETAFTSQSASAFSAPGQTSKTSRLPSSVITLHSPSVSQSTQIDTSTLAQSSSKEMVSVMTKLVTSLTVSISNSSLTSSPPINATSAASPATPSASTAQPTAPTLPPEGTKFVSMEVSFDIAFKEEYRDTSSPEYEELKNNLTTTLEEVYKNVEGFVGVRILFFTKGSVVCSYIVILAKDSKVEESELKDTLQKASDDGKVFKVNSIKVVEDDSEKTEEKLPKWALVVMIVLGCLSAVFLITVIYVCVKYRRSLYGSSEGYLVSTGEIGSVHTYDTVSIGDNKTGANQVHAQKPAAERRVIASHTNPTYGSNGAVAD